MIRRPTVVYLILLLALAAVYFYLNNRGQTADIELTPEPGSETAEAFLFTAAEGSPVLIRIEAKAGETVEVARGEDNAWAVTEPQAGPAEQGASEAAASQVTTMRIVDRVPADVDPGIIGLEEPDYVLTLEFAGGEKRIVQIGALTPTESGYYVRSADGDVVIVSRSAVDSLLGLLTSPPYLATPAEGAGTAFPVP